MNMILSAPSKTFLTGEYAVLAGGPALVLNTKPRFELRALKGETALRGIPEASPAGVWLKQRAPLLEGWNLEFADPHDKRGGFGASGAQFLLAHSFTTLLQWANQTPQLNPADVFNDYLVCSKGSGSGADILAQMKGGVAHVDMQEARAEKFAWPYPDLGFAILRTGSKLATHLHLQNLKSENLKVLLAPATEAALSFGRDSSRDFAAKVKDYAGALRELNLQCERTLDLLRPFEKQSWCLAAKGCGAWGADTLLLLFPKEAFDEAARFSEEQGLSFGAHELSSGLEVEYP